MWLEIEDFLSFYLDQTKVWAVIDCSWRIEAGTIIIDWKTGMSTTENISLQLAGYVMCAMEKWGIKPDKITLIEYNFLANQAVEFFITTAEIKNDKTYISGYISDMQSLLVDEEINVFKEERSLQKVEEQKVRANCNSRKVWN